MLSHVPWDNDTQLDVLVRRIASRFYRGSESENNDFALTRKFTKCFFYSPSGVTVYNRAKETEQMPSAQMRALDTFC